MSDHQIEDVSYYPICDTCGEPVTLNDRDEWEHATPAQEGQPAALMLCPRCGETYRSRDIWACPECRAKEH